MSNRLDTIDGLRALAALWVVCCHAWFEPANGYYASSLLNHLGLSYGSLAVDVFIVVSGFCLMLPIVRRNEEFGSVREFFRRRVRRILPPYYAALLLSVLFILAAAHTPTGTVWDSSLPLTVNSFVQHLLLVHDLPLPNRGGGINYPLWSIAVECQIYLFFPLIALSLKRYGNGVTLLWTGLLGLGMPLLCGHGWWEARTWYLGQFTLGAVTARECAAGRDRQEWRSAAMALGALVLGIVFLGGRSRYEIYKPYLDTLVAVPTALLLGAAWRDASERKWRVTRLLSSRPLAAVGAFSYSLYLVHAPLLHAAYLIYNPLLHPRPEIMFLLLLGTIPLIVGAAYLFYLPFEKPFLRFTAPRLPAQE